MNTLKSNSTGLFVLVLLLSLTELGWTQGLLRDSLERLDVDKDGRIDPDEITPLARPYLETIARSRRMSLDRSNDVEEFQEAARIYHALKNGVSSRGVEYEGEKNVKTFRPDRDDVLVPEFGLPEIKYLYTRDDLREADRTLRRYDDDDDGYIDRDEARYARWTHIPPFHSDLNNDDRLSRMELGQRYARRRMLDDAADELVQKSRRVGSEVRRDQNERSNREERSSWWRKGGSSYWLTASILGRFDSNRNGRLEKEEAQALGIPFGQLDADRDGILSRDELQAYMTQKQNEAGDVTEGLPGWFYELDENRDGQVAMSEFAEEWSEAKLREFASLDINDDGYLTTIEVSQSKAMMGGSYSNSTAEVLPPRKTIISEIEVTDDFVIGDLNLQLSITHTSTSFLDGYLTGPDGQRIELFTEIGGSGDHFEQTVFDDQSRYPVNKARPPFKGTFQPEGTVKKQPGLSYFNGKQAQGVWQLVIRCTRSERFGMLHSWSLIFKPIDDMLDSEPTLTEDGPAEEQTTYREQRGPSSQAEAEQKAVAAKEKWNQKWAQMGKDISPEEKEKMIEQKRSQLERYRQWIATQGDKPISEGKRAWAEKAEAELKGLQKGDPGSKEDKWSRKMEKRAEKTINK